MLRLLADGNPLVLSNVNSRNTISVDPDAVICWMGYGHCDPQIKADLNWKTLLIGRAPPVSPMLLSGAAVSR